MPTWARWLNGAAWVWVAVTLGWNSLSLAAASAVGLLAGAVVALATFSLGVSRLPNATRMGCLSTGIHFSGLSAVLLLVGLGFSGVGSVPLLGAAGMTFAAALVGHYLHFWIPGSWNGSETHRDSMASRAKDLIESLWGIASVAPERLDDLIGREAGLGEEGLKSALVAPGDYRLRGRRREKRLVAVLSIAEVPPEMVPDALPLATENHRIRTFLNLAPALISLRRGWTILHAGAVAAMIGALALQPPHDGLVRGAGVTASQAGGGGGAAPRPARPNAEAAALDAAALLEDGRAHLAAGRGELAAVLFEQYLTLDTENRRVWLDLGQAYRDTGDWNRATDAALGMLAAFPNDPEAMFELGGAMAAQDRVDDALDWYERVLQSEDSGLSGRALRAIEALTER